MHEFKKSIENSIKKSLISFIFQYRFIVVNLDRPEPDLTVTANNDSIGFFEISGFTQEVPKLIYALGKHYFS